MTPEDKIDILTAENALLRNALQYEFELAQKKVELLQLRQSRTELTAFERNLGSSVWRTKERLAELMDSLGEPLPYLGEPLP